PGQATRSRRFSRPRSGFGYLDLLLRRESGRVRLGPPQRREPYAPQQPQVADVGEHPTQRLAGARDLDGGTERQHAEAVGRRGEPASAERTPTTQKGPRHT